MNSTNKWKRQPNDQGKTLLAISRKKKCNHSINSWFTRVAKNISQLFP